MALRRHLEGVAEVRISQERQSAEVILTAGPHAFHPSEFRAAVGEAEVEVLRLEIDVCGHLQRKGEETWLVAGPNRFLVVDEWPPGRDVTCASAVLDDAAGPVLLRRLEPLAAGQD